jgi:ABC-type amino acid transport substrate-binding protein
MSSHATTSSSNAFRLLFTNALKAYEKRTTTDLLSHPLATQLEACNSPSAILDILQLQIHEFNQSRTTDERWTKWVDPTVNVLYALSETLGEGASFVGLVS